MHQMALLVKPPASTMTSLGRPVQSAGVPAAAESLAIGSAASKAKAMQALITPQNRATSSPLRKLNSLMESRFAVSGNSRSLLRPASADTVIPMTQIPIPSRVIRPGPLAAIVERVPLKIGGISVPQAAQIPRATP